MLIATRFFESKFNFSLLILSIILNLFFQYVIILATSASSIYILIGYNLFLLLLLFYKKSINNLATLLIVINFFPLIYLNNEFHYNFMYEILTAFPMLILLILSIFHFTFKTKDLSINVSYLSKPIIFIVIYFTVLGMAGIFTHQNSMKIIEQLFQIYLYLLILPISYFLYKREFYHSVLFFLLAISVIIALEYILINQFMVNFRFVTFQSGFLPLFIGIMFSYILYSKNSIRRIIAALLLVIIIAGTFITLTRSLWITTILVMFLVLFFYLKMENKLSVYQIILLFAALSIPLILMRDMGISPNQKNLKNNVVKYRAQSVINPLEDNSFLMRVEFAYYAFQRFLESPLIGKGLGNFLKYKIFNISNAANYYIDNSWLYFLWKGGLIGFLLFLWLYIRFFKTSYFVLKNTSDMKVKYITLGLLGGFIGLCFLGFLSPLLIKYKTNALIVFFFAYIEFERQIINKLNSESTLIE